MPLCSYAENYLLLGTTAVSNLFIQNYLPRASGDYVRVYLYGLMQCQMPHEDLSVEKMARLLDLPADAVSSAYQYWERQGLVVRVSDRPPAYQYLPLAGTLLTESPLDQAIYKHRDFNNSLQKLFGNRLLHPAEFSTACEWVDDLKIPEEVVLIMVEQYVKTHGERFQFKGLNKAALKWAEEGIVTVEAARDAVLADTQAYKTATAVLRQFGLRRKPTLNEVDLAVKWMGEWGMTQEAILLACRETVSGRNPSFKYLDAILMNHRDAKTREALDQKLRAGQTIDDALKELHRALGLRSISPTPEEARAYENYLAAGLEPQAIQKIADALGKSGSYSMEDLSRSLNGFLERAQLSSEQVEAHMQSRELIRARASEVLALCGLTHKPSGAEMAMVEDWLKAHSFDLIRYAAECALGTQLPMRYIAKLLSNWKAEHIVEVGAARKYREGLAARREAAAPAGRPASQQYAQREAKQGELDWIFEDIPDDEGGRNA